METVIASLINVLSKLHVRYEIIAVDNGSRDNTGKIIDKFTKRSDVKKVYVPINQGYGYGILEGLKECKGTFLGYLWGDTEVPHESLLSIYHALKHEGYDLCKITRIKRDVPFLRKLQTRIYNGIMRYYFGIKSNDANGCPKVMRRNLYKKLKLESKDWFLDPEIMIKCKDYKIKEIPVLCEARKHGKSKIYFTTSFEFIKNIMRYKN